MRSCIGVTGATGYEKIGQRKANFFIELWRRKENIEEEDKQWSKMNMYLIGEKKLLLKKWH